MLWIVFVVLQAVVIITGIRREQQAGLWSWSKFLFAIGFAGLEFLIIWAPTNLIDEHSRYYVALLVVAIVIAAANFIWFIIACRNWRLPDGRTSIQAYRDEHDKPDA